MTAKTPHETVPSGVPGPEGVCLESILGALRKTHPDADPERLRRACRFLAECGSEMSDQVAPNLISDAVGTAAILAEINADEESLLAALLLDLVVTGCRSLEDIGRAFGPDVATLVDRVSRTSRIRFKSRLEAQAENFRKMILALAQDLRVVLLNLARRLQIMRSLDRLAQAEGREVARETLEIYAPLANRLGIARVKTELEDLCLKALQPAIYAELEQRVPQDRRERSAYIRRVAGIIRKEMAEHHIPGTVVGRLKHFYSIYQKMLKRGVSFDEIFDLTALRVITDTTSHCYEVLGLIHALWKPIPGRFKDYIGVPKANMYQSLHTTVMGPQGQKVEFQIRTEEMHRVAEKGIAAHWKYKEGIRTTLDAEKKFAWLRQLLEWQQELRSPREFMESVKTDLFRELVYVFTPAGEIKELPSGATPLDFAYSIHSDVGNRCVGAKVNNRIVPLRTALKTGDTVEILTSKNQTPNKDWLKLVKTTKARNRIRYYLKQVEQEKSRALGREILEKEARKHGLRLSRILKSDALQESVGELGFSSIEKVIAAVGFGKISARQVLNRFLPEETAAPPPAVKSRKPPTRRREGIKIRGVEDILVHFSRCCTPVPGDEIIGFITRGQGVSIHRSDCPNVGGGSLNPDRLVEVDWDLSEESVRPVGISVITQNRPGILASISARISSEEINIRAADVRVGRDGRAACHFELEIRHRKDLDRILHAISQLRDVLEVKRLSGTP